MAKETEQIVLDTAQKIADKYKLTVVDVELKKEGPDWFLRIYIDKTGGVNLDDCELVSRELDALLDEMDLISQQYYLEVSSPGADRKLKKEREFLYYLNREVDVKLYKAIDGRKEFRGVLKNFQDKTAYISVDGQEVPVLCSEAAWIRLAFDF